MKREVKKMLDRSRELIGKGIYSKMKKIKDENEQEKALKYVVVSYLEKENHDIDMKIKSLELKKDLFFAKTRSKLLPSKIKFFKAYFNLKELDKTMNFIKSLKKEVENV